MNIDKDQLRSEFDAWLDAIPKPNEYNRMYGHHLTSFEAGFNAALNLNPDREKRIKELEQILRTAIDFSTEMLPSLAPKSRAVTTEWINHCKSLLNK